MDRDARIYVAGHRGLVGSALVRRLRRAGYSNLLLRTHDELDLTRGCDVADFFSTERPEFVFLAAARVGGIVSNDTYPAEFIRDNLLIQTSVIDASWRTGVRKLLFLGSSCIYPKHAPQPIKEEYLLTGALESTNEAYAIAKIAGIKMCAAYNRQYGTDYLCVMPTNLYGPGDNYDLGSSHVLPALLRKMHEAKESGRATVELWGTGRPRREFLHSSDLADACVHLMREHSARDLGGLVNVGVGKDITIAELGALVAETVGYEGELKFNPDYPDGTPRKLLDVSRLRALGWAPRIGLREGLRMAYAERTTEGASRVV